MTTKQKLTIALISSVLVGTYATIFIYQRIQRAKADASVVSENEALKIINDVSNTPEPDFTEEDTRPILPDDEVVDNSPSEQQMQFEIETGLGDY
jgi:Flp pilus assembly CpaF family ATPase